MPEGRAADERDRSLADRSETPSCPSRAPFDAAKRLVGSQAIPGLIAPGTLPLPALARPILRLIDGVGGVTADTFDHVRIATALSRCRVPLRPPP